jgi:outer membrane protein TolC
MWNLAGSLTAPIFEGGRRRAEVARIRAALEERLQGFGAVLLQALQEVEDALVRERKHEEYLEALDRQLEVARANLREARTRYVNGLVEYLNVLTALSTSQQLERARLQAGRELLTFRIQLYRALGGSWSRQLAPRDPDDAVTMRMEDQ